MYQSEATELFLSELQAICLQNNKVMHPDHITLARADFERTCRKKGIPKLEVIQVGAKIYFQKLR
jgi:hypothetical protein